MPGEVECDDVLNYWNYCSFIRQFRRQLLSGTPCTGGADDRARRFVTHRTPCTESADDRARRFVTHRTPCMRAHTTVLAYLMHPPHSLHLQRSRPCSHICDPPHSLH